MIKKIRTIYANVDSPNLAFPYFNISGGSSRESCPKFLASQDAHDVIWVSEWWLADFTDVTLVSEDVV